MSDRPTITTLPSGGRYDTSTLNGNFQALRDKFDDVLGRNGTTGSNNAATGDMDLGGYDIRNIGSIGLSGGDTIADNVTYAKEWANNAEDLLVSTAAGGDSVDDYSALHHAAKAAASETVSAAAVVSTAADVVSTAADVVTSAATVATLTGAASTTSLLIAVASKAFTVAAGLSFQVGDWVLATSDADEANYMHGQITGYASTTMTVNVTNIGGAGTLADWTIRRSGTQGAIGATGSTGATGPAGSGDVVGPASATDGAVAKFDGTTGKLLKDGVVLGTVATLNTGTGNGNIPVLDAVGLPAIDGSQLTGLTGGGPSLGTDSVIRTNAQTISENITFAGTENGMSAGPITIAATYTVTVTTGSTWSII